MAGLPTLFVLLSLLPSPGRQAPPVPPSHEPAMTPGGQASAPAPAPAGLVFQLPAGWVNEKPSSSMRLAQATIPGSGGRGGVGSFSLGRGGGGTPEANIDRWVGQIDNPAAPPHRDTFAAHGLKITWVEVAGTMKPTTVGMGPATAQPGYRLLGAVVEGTDGPWYLKVTGPDATVAAARGAFLDLLHGLQPR
jgi:hypothetical protein